MNEATRMNTPLLELIDVARYFDVSPPWLNRLIEGKSRQVLKAVDGVSLTIAKGETLGLVGESGCGKSTVARLIVGLYRPTRGEIRFAGRRIDFADAELALRRTMQMIFQDPYASLNPRWRVADIVAEPIRAHGIAQTPREIAARVAALLEQVGLAGADGGKYPHQFSGGQRQRVSIARALATNPAFLVCDEPTSALDVSVQAQVLNLMRRLQRDLGLTYLFISHNLAVVHHVADRVGVMYLGRIVELAPTRRDLRLAAASVHPHAARRRAGPVADGQAAHCGRGRGTQSTGSSARLCVPSALSVRERALPRGNSAAAAGRGTAGGQRRSSLPCGRRRSARASAERGVRPRRRGQRRGANRL